MFIETSQTESKDIKAWKKEKKNNKQTPEYLRTVEPVQMMSDTHNLNTHKKREKKYLK